MPAGSAEAQGLAPPSSSTLAICAAGAALLPLFLIADWRTAGAAITLAALGFMATLALQRPRLFLTLLLCVAPLSVDWPTPLGGVHLTVPLEVMLVLGPLGLLLRDGREALPTMDQARHPLSLLILGNTLWVVATAFMSTDFLVSAKFATARILYVVAFFVFGLRVLKGVSSIAIAVVAIGAGLVPVIGLALGRYAASAFQAGAVYESAQPFFQNRVDLCALLALWLPLALASWIDRRSLGLAKYASAALGLSLVMTVVALVALRARSALGALAVAAFVAFLSRRLRPAFVTLVLFIAVFTAGLVTMDLVAYRSEIARPGAATIPSPTRSALLGRPPFSDESFTERANRWGAAARLASSRPVLGWGPGTFEMRYGPFQRPHEMTRLSTWTGERGDAHSEWMSSLAEQGAFGFLLLLSVLSGALFFALRAAFEAARPAAGWMEAALAGTVAAFVVLNGPNSFLDTDKVVPLFWLACAAAVNLDRRRWEAHSHSTSREGR